MSLRTIQRAAIAGVLTLGVLSGVGCDDDDDNGGGGGDMDAGPDGGPGGDDGGPGGDMDAGPDSGGGDLQACTGEGEDDCICEVGDEEETCEQQNAGLIQLPACCDEKHGGACGNFVPELAGPLAGCHAEGLQGQASSHCGAFLDQIEGEMVESDATEGFPEFDHTNGMYDAQLDVGRVVLPGCCTPDGGCGILVNSFDVLDKTGAAVTSIDVEFGCIPIADFAASTGGDAGAGDAGAGDTPTPTLAPFCWPEAPLGDAGVAEGDRACPPKMGITLGGSTVNLCESFVGTPLENLVIGCDPEDDFPNWLCLLQGGGRLISGEVPEVGNCMEFVPSFVHGCGAPTGANCVPGMPADVYGCEDIDELPEEAQAAILGGLPNIACGCGDVENNPLCLNGVDANKCGGIPVSALNPTQQAAILGAVPEYVCGCGPTATTNSTDAFPTVCLANTAPDTCGQLVVDADIAPFPEIVCGCGEDAVYAGGIAPPCFSHVPPSVCGTEPATTQDKPGVQGVTCVPKFYEIQVGCGEDEGASGYPTTCIPHVAENVIGCEDVTAQNAPVLLASVPSTICGCGNTTAATAPGCLSYVPEDVCGQAPD